MELLAEMSPGGLGVFAGQPLSREAIETVDALQGAQLTLGRNWHFLDPSLALYMCWQSGLLGWLETWQPQILVVEANPRYLSTRRAIAWMHARNRPVLGWGLGAPVLRGRVSGLRSRERWNFLRRLDGIIAYSQRAAVEYRQAGVPAERVFVAANAAARRPTQSNPERPLELDRAANVLFVGRLQRRKRLDLLFQACAALPVVMQPRLVVVGDGPARLEFEAQARSMYPKAEFVGARHGAELQDYFAEADLFVLPGTGGLAVQQAMAHALPVIVAQGDGTQDDLVRSPGPSGTGSGWQVPPGDLAALVQALHTALADISKLRMMGREAYRIVNQEINLESMAQAFLAALESVSTAVKNASN